ncbi:DNA repair protein RecN [Kallipyga massiliensis]|uniref:DNA repair protein RecN n=1 Tax=Kallipyga massiliensis TaxID=1472764 RepID=UPI0004AD353A|nr:DNA repair protein RecN [Kallipyga massiliensis]
MLDQLRIRNFALIQDWKVNIREGETVVTGETGSGKSLFVSAIQYLMGGTIDREMRRDPDRDLVVEGLFRMEKLSPDFRHFLDENDIPWDEEGSFLIRRSMDKRGNSQRVNDMAISRNLLRSLSDYLIDIHAQNAQSLLKTRDRYLPLLDTYLGEEAEDLKGQLVALLRKRKVYLSKLDDLDLAPDELAREKDLLAYQIGEIREANLEEVDEEALNREYKTLASAEERAKLAGQVLSGLRSDGQSLRWGLQSMAHLLEDLYRKDPDSQAMKDLAWQMEAEAEALEDQVESYSDNIILDGRRMAEIHEIFQTLQSLRKKYGQTFEEILAYLERAEKKKKELESVESLRSTLIDKVKGLDGEIEAVSGQLSRLRKEAAGHLEDRIREELQEMAIKKVDFLVNFQEKIVGPDGRDEVDFMISTNPGQPPESLSKVASGGEMSRFMLAFKIVVAQIQDLPSLIFDEIDTGISGRTAQVVAEKISRLSEDRQVMVITHLPQIAALADHHLKIDKKVEETFTYSYIRALDFQGRVEEEARLIGGARLTNTTRRSAEEMLYQAQELKARGAGERRE